MAASLTWKRDDERKANLCRADLPGLPPGGRPPGGQPPGGLPGQGRPPGGQPGRANLQKATLWGQPAGGQPAGGRPAGGQPVEAQLQKANLQGANLQEATGRHLQGACVGANLQEADLRGANLQEAFLGGANLQEANLGGADLQKADLGGANLQEANLVDANLQKANLVGANLQEADLLGANLQKAIYEPKLGTLPNFWTLTDPDNHLETLVFHHSPAALIALREAFKKGGMRTQERQLTYAIEHTKQLQAWHPRGITPKTEDTRPWSEKLTGKSESLFSYVLFELPSAYGMAPGRALWGFSA